MKKPSLAIAGAAAILILLSGCSILSGIPGLGGPDPRCAAIEDAFAQQINSDESNDGRFEAFDVAKVDLPGSVSLPSATCSFRFLSEAEDSAGAYYVFGFYLTQDESRADAIGANLTSADFIDYGGGHWSSPPADDGSTVDVNIRSIEDSGMDGDEEFVKALGTEGDVISVWYTPATP